MRTGPAKRRVLLLLPLFFEFARSVRRGVLDWIDEHPEWSVVEMEPERVRDGREVAKAFDGVLSWLFSRDPVTRALYDSAVPLIDCGSGELAEGGLPAGVTFDRRSLSRLAARHFEAIGLEVAVYVGSILRTGKQRRDSVAAFRREVLALGIESLEFEIGEFEIYKNPNLLAGRGEVPALKHFLESLPKPAGLLAEDDYVATLVVETALRAGLRVPEDVAVLGQGDRTVAATAPVPISSVELPGEAVGYEAARRLNLWMKGKPPKPRRISLPCETIRVRQSTGGMAGDLGIERARRYLDRHCVEGVTLEVLSAVAGCSEKTLKRRFRDLHGVEVVSWIRERRLEEARRLIEQEGLSLGEVAARCGFPSQSNFFNFIRRQTGCSPTELRARALLGGG